MRRNHHWAWRSFPHPGGRSSGCRSEEGVKDQVGDEVAHALRVGCRRGGGKSTSTEPSYHLLFVLMATAPRKWALVVISSIEGWPPAMAEAGDASKIGEEPSRLGAIDVRELTLVASDAPAASIAEGLPKFRKLPDAGWLSSVSAA